MTLQYTYFITITILFIYSLIKAKLMSDYTDRAIDYVYTRKDYATLRLVLYHNLGFARYMVATLSIFKWTYKQYYPMLGGKE